MKNTETLAEFRALPGKEKIALIVDAIGGDAFEESNACFVPIRDEKSKSLVAISCYDFDNDERWTAFIIIYENNNERLQYTQVSSCCDGTVNAIIATSVAIDVFNKW